MKQVKEKVLQCNPKEEGLATYVPEVVYSRPEPGVELKLWLLLPREAMIADCAKKFPCIVFLQGSAWTTPDVYYEVPELSSFARAGYVVASIMHRSSEDGARSPAFLIDYKCAIRFLRARADEYSIDRDRIAAWGTSSGGNTALLAALTADNAAYKSAEWAAESDAVKTCVACFPPTDIPDLFRRWENGEGDELQDTDGRLLVKNMFGDDESTWSEKMREISPICRIPECKKYPSFLLLHGDADGLVPFSQSERMAEALSEAGADVGFVRVHGAGHEGNFWSPAVLDEIKNFIDCTL